MAALPAGFTLRPPFDADAAAIAAMINEETTALRGFAVVSVEWVLTPWSAPGTDRERDFAVVAGPGGDLAGYLFVESDPPHTEVTSIGVVALRHHGRRLGAAVVGECERRAQRFVALADPGLRVVMHAGSLAEEPRVAALLRAHGYTEVRRFTAMRIDFAGAPAAPEQIAGIEIRGLHPGQERAVYACLAEAFADHWGDTWPTEEAWMHHHVAAADCDPGLWQLAWHGAELAGALVAEPRSGEDPAVGYVAALGVRRAYRRRGIAEALLRTSFRQAHARGASGMSLHVDTQSTTGATRVYERTGMTAQPRFATWEKELRGGMASMSGL
jgi:ribosomal protein S18 acetylase RimI-like enzyme